MRTSVNADHDAPLPREVQTHLRTTTFTPPRRRWPGILAATVIGAGIAAAAVSSFYDQRSLGERVDAATAAASNTRQQVGGSMQDASITAAVKTALAADPALSALKIEVTTTDGVVHLTGPAPDDKARERAQVLAAAPAGVTSVDNQLVVPPAGTTTN